MGNACSASKKKIDPPLKSQDVQSPKPPPSEKENNIENLNPINENVPKNAERLPESELPQKEEEAEQRVTISNQKNSLFQNEIISPNPEPLPPSSFHGMGEENEGWQAEQMDGEKIGGNEVQEEPRHLEEMNFNEEGEEGVERGEEGQGEEIFQNDYYENQNQSDQQYTEMYDGGNNEDERDEDEEYDNNNNNDDEEAGTSAPKMKNARKSVAGPVLMALKAENVNDFFVAPTVKEEQNEGEANNEFKNANNETEDHENNFPGEAKNESEQAPQVKHEF